jgi:hypothetical protein
MSEIPPGLSPIGGSSNSLGVPSDSLGKSSDSLSHPDHSGKSYKKAEAEVSKSDGLTKKGESTMQQWFETYAGPQGWAKFESNMCKMIGSEIANERKKAKEATKKLKDSETGQD